MKYIVVAIEDGASDSPAAIAEWIREMLNVAESTGCYVVHDPSFNYATRLGDIA